VTRLRYERRMTEKPAPKATKPQRTAAEVRQERLKAALKANMARRKTQMRLRATDKDNKNA
jgi:hypothetical protein